MASPCVGIHGCGYALSAMGVPADSNNIFDLEPGYMAHLWQHLRAMGMESIKLHLGWKLGDLLKFDLRQLELPVDFLVSGPPCPPGQARANGAGSMILARRFSFAFCNGWCTSFMQLASSALCLKM